MEKYAVWRQGNETAILWQSISHTLSVLYHFNAANVPRFTDLPKGFNSRQGQNNFPFSETSRPAVGPTQP
jgi:hypothetical protein